jgi:hypothetical protein
VQLTCTEVTNVDGSLGITVGIARYDEQRSLRGIHPVTDNDIEVSVATLDLSYIFCSTVSRLNTNRSLTAAVVASLDPSCTEGDCIGERPPPIYTPIYPHCIGGGRDQCNAVDPSEQLDGAGTVARLDVEVGHIKHLSVREREFERCEGTSLPWSEGLVSPGGIIRCRQLLGSHRRNFKTPTGVSGILPHLECRDRQSHGITLRDRSADETRLRSPFRCRVSHLRTV